MVLVESSRVLRRKRFHRQKLHLVLSGMRHLAAELGTLLDAEHAEPVAALGLRDDFDEVQVAAVELAGRFDLESLRPALVAMLVDDHLMLRTAAAGALLRMDAAR